MQPFRTVAFTLRIYEKRKYYNYFKFISLFKKYGIKATFNINTGILGKTETLPILCFDGEPLHHDIVTEKQLLAERNLNHIKF